MTQEASWGRLIALEGVDGCGKSTQARLLATSLGALLTFEPGDTPFGQAVRQLMLGFQGDVSARAEALLVAADRAQHVNQVLGPALGLGRWVVTDRYDGSTLAYQGWGRGLGVNELVEVLSFATGGLAADLSILIDVPVSVARGRLAESIPDRLERLDIDFHERVAAGYRALADAEPERWAVVDGTGAVAEVAVAVQRSVEARLGKREHP